MALIIAALAFFITSFGVVIEYKSIVISRGIQKWLMHESEAASIERDDQGNIGDQLEEWMLRETELPDGTKVDNLGALTRRIGHGISASLRGASMQEKSVDARIQNKYDLMVKDGIQQSMPFEVKILKKGLQRFGIDLDEVLNDGDWVPLTNALRKYGIEVPNLANPQNTSGGGNIPQA